MLSTIIEKIFHTKELKKLRDTVGVQEVKIKYLQQLSIDPRRVVSANFKRGLKWFDYEELTESARRNYYGEAQMILKSDVFNNELAYLRATGSQAAILDAMPGKEAEAVRDFTMTVNGYELLQQRLEEIKNPDKKETKDNLDSAI